MDKKLSKSALTGYMVALIGALIFLLSGFGYQWGWWGLGTAFRTLIPLGAGLALLGLISSAYGLYVSRSYDFMSGMKYAVVGILFGALTVGAFGYWYLEAQKYPPIHDITTDMENPPEFDAIVPLREEAPNMTEYAGEETAEIQKEHYPDIQTYTLPDSPREAFQKALAAAEQTSWEIVNADTAKLIIEATHTLAWYGFKDDVVVRVDTTEQGSKIDVRSVSRIGQGDIGVNAHRIRNYLDLLD